MNKIILENVSLVAVTTSGDEEATLKAIEFSSKNIVFKKKLLLTDKINLTQEDVDIIKISKLNNLNEWGKFIIFDLYKYINTDFIILIHSDGYIINPESWTNEFLNYDYIGAPWKIPKDQFTFRDKIGRLIRVGNSVSIRSKKILKAPTELGLKWKNFLGGFAHEDGFLCVQHRIELENYGIHFGNLNIACQFGREYNLPEHKNIKPFTFHKWHGPNSNYPCFNPFYVKIKMLKKVINKILRGLNFE